MTSTLQSARSAGPPDLDAAAVDHAFDAQALAVRERLDRGQGAGLGAGGALGIGDHDIKRLTAALAGQVWSYHDRSEPAPWAPIPPRARSSTPMDVFHGIRNLVVADASIMPAVPAANTNLPTIMVAERIAAWLMGTAG